MEGKMGYYRIETADNVVDFENKESFEIVNDYCKEHNITLDYWLEEFDVPVE